MIATFQGYLICRFLSNVIVNQQLKSELRLSVTLCIAAVILWSLNEHSRERAGAVPGVQDVIVKQYDTVHGVFAVP